MITARCSVAVSHLLNSLDDQKGQTVVISSLLQMTKVTRDHCLEIITKFEPSSDNQKQGLLGIDGMAI